MTPGLIRKAWVKRGPWISARGRACDEEEVPRWPSELIFPQWAPCPGRPRCGRTAHTAPGWSRWAAWEGRGSFWSPLSSPATLGGNPWAFPGGELSWRREEAETGHERLYRLKMRPCSTETTRLTSECVSLVRKEVSQESVKVKRTGPAALRSDSVTHW